MPTYAYACKDCGHHFDIVQAFTDDALTSCPDCEGRLRKVWGSVGVVFKGSGFYSNDSRAAKTSTSPASEKSASSDKSDTSSKSETGKKSDTSSKSESGKKSDSSSASSSSKSASSSSSGSAA